MWSGTSRVDGTHCQPTHTCPAPPPRVKPSAFAELWGRCLQPCGERRGEGRGGEVADQSAPRPRGWSLDLSGRALGGTALCRVWPRSKEECHAALPGCGKAQRTAAGPGQHGACLQGCYKWEFHLDETWLGIGQVRHGKGLIRAGYPAGTWQTRTPTCAHTHSCSPRATQMLRAKISTPQTPGNYEILRTCRGSPWGGASLWLGTRPSPLWNPVSWPGNVPTWP